MKLKLNEKVMYTGHGIGIVTNIGTKTIDKKAIEFFTIEIVNSGLKIMVPANHVESLPVRKIASKNEVLNTMSNLSTNARRYHNGWIMRSLELKNLLQSGQFKDNCEVYRHLLEISRKGSLSFGEIKLLDVVKPLVINEMALACDMHKDKAEEMINEKI